MAHDSDRHAAEQVTELDTGGVDTLADLAGLLRKLRRRHARTSRDSELTYRELAAKTGWSPTAIAEYFTGRTLPPTDRFDALIGILGATPPEQGSLATARDRVAERRRTDRVAPPSSEVPRQLPAAVRRFAGRVTEMAVLNGLLDEPVTPGAVRVAAISGTAGIGKTTLAVQWAHQVAHRFPDGQLHVNLRGFDQSGEVVPPSAAILGFLDALGAQAPAGPDAQAALYRSLLSDRRMLILLDNARDAAQVRPLLPGAPGCLVLVTSRSQLSGLVATDGAEPIVLDVLSTEEARELLGNSADYPAAVDELITLCGRLPLALAVVAARAATNPNVPLPELARELGDRLSALSTDDPATDLRAVFSWSYRALSPEAATVFGLLGLVPGPDIDVAAAASLTARPQVRVALRELEMASLLQQYSPGRYRMHDLIRLYAKDLADDPDAGRRLVDFYLHTAVSAESLLQQLLPPVPLEPPADGCQPLVLADQATALAWFAAEYRNLQAAQGLAAECHWSRDVWRLAWALTTFLYRQGRFHDALAVWRVGEAASAQLDDPTIRTGTLQMLGAIYAELGRHAEALEHLNLAAKAGDTPGHAYTHHALGWLWSLSGDNRRALHHATEALHRYRALGIPAGEVRELTVMSWYRALSGDHDRARTDGESALAMARRHEYAEDVALSTSVLGYIAFHTGRLLAARSHLQQADMLLHNVGNTYYQANALDYLGRTLLALDDPAYVLAWQRALELYQQQHRAAEADDLRQRLRSPGTPAAGRRA